MQAPFADPLSGLEHLRASLPLVGREFEIQVIRALLDTVALDLQAGARALVISGEMGVGKTRLLATLSLEARSHHFRVLDASAFESGSAIPYFPFIEALRLLLRSATQEQLQRWLGLATEREAKAMSDSTDSIILLAGAPLVAALTHLFPELPTMLHISRQQMHARSEMLSPEQEKFRLHDAVATLLERAAEEQPVALCIDNLQWADSASLQLMLYLTMRLRTSCVALVGVTRPQHIRTASGESDESQATANKILGDLVRQGMLLLLPLAPLSQEAMARHLQALLPGIVSQSMIQTLLNRVEGNPFFLEELVRTLALTQQLVLCDGAWRVARVSSTKLPENIILAVEQRLYGLSETCRDLLHIAALFGRTFPVEALAHALGKSVEEIQPFIDEALEASVIAQDPATDQYDEQKETEVIPLQSYIFCQGIVQEVLRAGVPTHRARSLHSAIGRALEVNYAHEARKHAAELARHYALGGEKEATLRWSLLAGEDAARQQAHREAISHFRLVLKLLEAEEEARTNTTRRFPSIAELQLTIGELWLNLGELDQASSTFQQTLQLLQRTPGVSALLPARVNRLLADAYRMQARYDQAFAHLQAASTALDEALSATPDTDDGRRQVEHITWHPGRDFTTNSIELDFGRASLSEQVQLLQSQATLNIMLNRPQEAETLLWQSHYLAIEMGDCSTQAFALHMIGYLRGWGEQIHEALRLQKQANDLYVALGDPYRAMMGEQGLGIIYQALGEMDLARRYILRGLERAQRYGVRRAFGWFYWNQGVMALFQGDWENSMTLLQQALQEALSHNDLRLRPLVMQTQAELAFRRGDWRTAEQLFLDGMQAATATEWFPSTVALYGHFLAVTGRRAAALAQLDRAAATPEPPGIANDFYLPFLAEGYIHLDLLDRARTYLERIRNLHGFMYYGNAVDRVLGVIAARMGDRVMAERAFEEGLILCQHVGNRPEEAAILYEQARMELMPGGSICRVDELCERARAIFMVYGMQRAVDMVDTLRHGAEQLKERQEVGKITEAVVPHTRKQVVPSAVYLPEQRLTKRELEVLRLVSEGSTDREVADMLVISPRTVNRHLSNIFVKLDVPGRAAAVAYAIRQGLV
jgi:predicted ATPase/DNA-binding CsgD family transcriptional regulator